MSSPAILRKPPWGADERCGWGADRLMEGFLLGRRECSTTDAKRSLRSSANLPKIPERLNRMVCELDAKGRCQETQM